MASSWSVILTLPLLDMKLTHELETLRALNKPPAPVVAPGEYLCENCGMAIQSKKAQLHLARCWGRCKRCHKRGIPCDSGIGVSFSPCSTCKNLKSKQTCERQAGTRAIAQRVSSLVKESKKGPTPVKDKAPVKRAAKGAKASRGF